MPDIGTYACYQTGCGHPACAEANLEYHRNDKALNRAVRYKGPDGEMWAPEMCRIYNKPVPHGTATGYTHHLCRCPRCKKAQSQEQAQHYNNRKNNQAIIRRLFQQKGLW